jgi:hypothetical protein
MTLNLQVDTHAGDLVFTLQALPHPTLRRRGEKDLETFAGAAPAGCLYHLVEVEDLRGRRVAVRAPALRAALEAGGRGGVWEAALPGRGLRDAAEPLAPRAAGALHVQVRYAPLDLGARPLVPPRLAPVLLLGAAGEAAPAAAAAGALAAALRHRLDAAEMAAEARGGAPRGGGAAAEPALRAVCVRVGAGAGAPGPPGVAAAAALRALAACAPRCVTFTADVLPSGDVADDAAWAALHHADCDVVLLDMAEEEEESAAGSDGEAALAEARRRLEAGGVLRALWARAWAGASLAAAGAAVGLLGAPARPAPPGAAPPVLPFYLIRSGGAAAGGGWAGLRAAVAASGADGAPPGVGVGVGVLESSALLVDPVSGAAEMLVAPRREALVAAAAAAAAEPPLARLGLAEAEDDYGFRVALERRVRRF